MKVRELIEFLELCDGMVDVYYIYNKQHKNLPSHIKDERIIKVTEKDGDAVYLS